MLLYKYIQICTHLNHKWKIGKHHRDRKPRRKLFASKQEFIWQSFSKLILRDIHTYILIATTEQGFEDYEPTDDRVLPAKQY